MYSIRIEGLGRCGSDVSESLVNFPAVSYPATRLYTLIGVRNAHRPPVRCIVGPLPADACQLRRGVRRYATQRIHADLRAAPQNGSRKFRSRILGVGLRALKKVTSNM